MNLNELAALSMEDVSRELDLAVSRSNAYFEVESNLPWTGLDLGQASEETRKLVIPVSAAFQYAVRHGRRERGMSPYIPMFTLDDENETEIPPSPGKVTSEWANTWSSIAELASTAAARARLHDLIFERRVDQVGHSGREAVKSYLEMSLTKWHPLDRAQGLLRAHEIAIFTKAIDLRAQTLARMLGFAREALAASEGPGVVLDVIELLLSETEYSSQAADLLSEARLVYGNDPFIVDQILVILRNFSSSQGVKAEYEAQRVQSWLRSAELREGAEKLFDLERAVQIADSAGLKAELAEARLALQNQNADVLPMQRFTRTLELPEEAVQEYVAQFTLPADWREALVAFALHAPLTGRTEDNYSAIEESKRIAPLSHSIPRVKLGSDGLPRWQPSTDEEKADDQLARQETLLFQMSSPVFALGLDAIGEHYGIDDASLRSFIVEQPSSNDRVADILSSAFKLYWSGRYTESAYLSIWQLESICREILLAADEGLYQTQRRRTPGQYPGLGHLIKQLGRLGLDQSWYRYLWTVFASPAGLNLRNEIAHGFVGQISKPLAAAVLHAAMYLCLVRGDPTTS